MSKTVNENQSDLLARSRRENLNKALRGRYLTREKFKQLDIDASAPPSSTAEYMHKVWTHVEPKRDELNNSLAHLLDNVL